MLSYLGAVHTAFVFSGGTSHLLACLLALVICAHAHLPAGCFSSVQKALEICRFNASSSNSNGTVDPDEQMQSLHVHNNSLYRRVENSFMDLATKLVRSYTLECSSHS
jgi:hypothetical protein